MDQICVALLYFQGLEARDTGFVSKEFQMQGNIDFANEPDLVSFFWNQGLEAPDTRTFFKELKMWGETIARCVIAVNGKGCNHIK